VIPENFTLSLLGEHTTLSHRLWVPSGSLEKLFSNADRFTSQWEMYKVEETFCVPRIFLYQFNYALFRLIAIKAVRAYNKHDYKSEQINQQRR